MRHSLKLGLLTAVVFAVFITGALSATSQTSFCQQCHEMETNYRSWKASTHSQVECIDCHVEPGYVNLLRDKMSASSQIVAHFSHKYRVPINSQSNLSAQMSSQNCLRCHNDLKPVQTDRLIFDHKLHKNAGFSCAYCHNRIAHPDIDGYKDRITMEFCVNCHMTKKAPITCKTCHPASFKLKPDSHDDKEAWIKSHGKGNLSSCPSCHYTNNKNCKDCHGLPMHHR